MKLAIDFGTTNTVIAHWDGGARIVALPPLSTAGEGAQSVVPSLLYVRNGGSGDVVAGQSVRDQHLDVQHDNRLFRNFKRGIVTQPAPAARPLDGVDWDDPRAGEAFLKNLLRALPKGPIETLVLTAPVSAFESYLGWLGEVMGDLASEHTYIVDESTAAALGYAVTEPGAPVMVFDFGGGTLDLSLVLLPESKEATGGFLSRLRRGRTSQSTARVIAKAGRIIGGSDIDQWLLGWVLERLGRTPADLGSHYTALLTACEIAKIRLSTSEETTIDAEIGGQRWQVPITRGALEHLLTVNGFYDALRHIVDKVMHVAHRSGIFREDVKYVLLVGGVSLMPSVQALLRSYFGATTVRADKPFTAVAEGALQVAAGYGLDDYLSQSYGLRCLDPQTGQHHYDEIIPMGSRYPGEKPVEVDLGAAHDGQTALEFVIGEIGAESAALLEVRYEGGQTVFVARADAGGEQVAPLNAHEPLRVPLEPPARRGGARVVARFRVDAQRHLRVTVTDQKTRRDLLDDAVVTTLGGSSARAGGTAGQVTGFEPLLTQPDGGQRRLSLRGVATMMNMLPPEAIALDVAEAALRSESFGARYNAAVMLSKRGDREARGVMQRVLTDGQAPSRATAARHLDGFSWYAAEPLLRQALRDSDARVREAAVYTLCAARELKAYHLMTEALQNEADNVLEAAAFGLRDCQDPAAVPVLAAALAARDPDVRVKTLEALSNNDSAQALPVVRAALGDPHPNVVYAAVLSLLELAHERALDELAAMIHNTQGRTREAILRAFFHATNYLNINPARQPDPSRLLSALGAALQDRQPPARIAAVWVLAWMRHPDGTALIADAYARESAGAVKAQVMRIAVALMAPGSEALLDDARASSDPVVREAAEKIVDARQRSGVVLTYDELAPPGKGFTKPSLSR